MINRREWHLPGTLELIERPVSSQAAESAFGAALHARLEVADDRVRQETRHLDEVEAVASAYRTAERPPEVLG
ncbi:MAG: hypothetical protein NTZ43_10030 [Gemmatimonadetes bacterium]|nr:hypothetical protein [Gemmatimonadota bacterium]